MKRAREEKESDSEDSEFVPSESFIASPSVLPVAANPDDAFDRLTRMLEEGQRKGELNVLESAKELYNHYAKECKRAVYYCAYLFFGEYERKYGEGREEGKIDSGEGGGKRRQRQRRTAGTKFVMDEDWAGHHSCWPRIPD